MSDNAEGGIASIQAKAAENKGLHKHHSYTIKYLNERVLTFLCLLSLIGLSLVWITTSSSLIFYGSLIAVIILTLLMGIARIKSIQKRKEDQARHAKEWKSNN